MSCNLDFSTDAAMAGMVVDDGLVLDGNSLANTISGSCTIRVAGEWIGIIGATTPRLDIISSPGDITVLPADESDYVALAGIIQSHADDLMTEGIDKIIVLAHMQQYTIELDELAPRLEGVDIIIAGGNHSLWANPTNPLRDGDSPVLTYPQWRNSSETQHPIAVINTGANYRYLGRLVARFDDQGVIIPSSVDATVSGSYATDAATVTALGADNLVDAAVERVVDAVGAIIVAKDGETYGRTEVYLDGLRGSVRREETNLGDLSADANLWWAQQSDPSVEISLKNGGGIRDSIGSYDPDPLNPRFLPPTANPAAGKEEGEVSRLDIENSLRFNNSLVAFTLTATQLVEVLEHGVADSNLANTPGRFPQVGGMTFSYVIGTPAGSRITDIAVGGSPVMADGALLVPADTAYRMVTLNFIEGGGDGYPFPDYAAADPDFYDRYELPNPSAGEGFYDEAGEQWALAQYLNAFHAAMETAYDQEELPMDEDTRIVLLSLGRLIRLILAASGGEPLDDILVTIDGDESKEVNEAGSVEFYRQDMADDHDLEFGEVSGAAQ